MLVLSFYGCSANFYKTSSHSWNRGGFANMTALLDLRVPMKLPSLPQNRSIVLASKRIPSRLLSALQPLIYFE